jgi:ubiquinone/menaquinone biosynthesis C-methylase UbiE
MSEDMFLDGFQNITDIDFSENAVKIIEDRYKEKNIRINYMHMDASDMSAFSKGQFQAVLDKGTLDSILCGENAIPTGNKYIREIYRILADNGTYICISYGDEDHRKGFFMSQEWNIKVEKIAKPNKIISSNINPEEKDNKNFHYVYIMNKKKN